MIICIIEIFFTNKSQFAAPLKAKSNMTAVRIGFLTFDEEDEKFKKHYCCTNY